MSVETNLARVHTDIASAARAAGRDPADVTLIAVAKGHSAAAIAPALTAGQRHFGENRVQEAAAKWPALRAQWPDLTLHLIGPLQTNKVHDAVALFDVIHSIDRPKLADKLAAEMAAQNRRLPCFVQVNTGNEPQKAGVGPTDAAALIAHCRDVCGLNVIGLMCVPPVDDDAAIHFAFLRELARRSRLNHLSMGMSGDVAAAVTFGATHVRIGTAIFGERAPQAV